MPRSLALVVLLAGCDDHVFPAASEGNGSCEPTWAGVQGWVSERCDGCHGGAAEAGGGVRLPSGIAEDMADADEPLYADYGELVVPGDAASSVLWQAVAHLGEVSPMPIGASAPVVGHACIQEWIDAGASLE